MNRKSNGESIRKVIKKLREEIPNVVIRTTVMVGFPGETNKDFEELYDFVKEAKFDRLGAFSYSKEEGTPAEKLQNHVHHKTKRSRYNKIMSLQKNIAEEQSKKHIGRTLKALIESKTSDGKYYISRTYIDSPDVDSITYIKNENIEADLVGTFVECKIIEANEYDYIAEI